MGAALDGDEFPVLRTHINVVSGGVRVFGAALRELVAAAEGNPPPTMLCLSRLGGLGARVM